MNIIFEGKEYTSQRAIQKEYFPTRSTNVVRRYIVDGGCKTVAEVLAAEHRAYYAGLAKSKAATRARAKMPDAERFNRPLK